MNKDKKEVLEMNKDKKEVWEMKDIKPVDGDENERGEYTPKPINTPEGERAEHSPVLGTEKNRME